MNIEKTQVPTYTDLLEDYPQANRSLLICLFVNVWIDLFIHLFTYSFIHSFIQSLSLVILLWQCSDVCLLYQNVLYFFFFQKRSSIQKPSGPTAVGCPLAVVNTILKQIMYWNRKGQVFIAVLNISFVAHYYTLSFFKCWQSLSNVV